MAQEKHSIPASEMLDRLQNLLMETCIHEAGSLHDAVIAEGMDPERLYLKAKGILNTLSTQEKMDSAANQLSVFRSVSDQVKGYSREKLAALRAELEEKSRSDSSFKPQLVFYRKLEKMSPEDLESLDEDEVFLDLIEDLRREQSANESG